MRKSRLSHFRVRSEFDCLFHHLLVVFTSERFLNLSEPISPTVKSG